MSAHFKRKAEGIGIGFSSTASLSASNNSKSDTSDGTVTKPNTVTVTGQLCLQETLHVNPNSVTIPPLLTSLYC